jgi:Serine endopeptidase inhibitors
MDKIEINNIDPNDLPFFARFLEGQMEDLAETESETVIGGHKPSRIRFTDITAITNKYPSDSEDIHAQPVTSKYPSDNEDMAITQKYPSDGDDDLGTSHPKFISDYQG